MKLYTEEQVIDILTSGSFPYDSDEIDEIFSEYTPIELPSDEEIEKESIDYSTRPSYVISFEDGAKWVIEHIKQQDNGN